MIWHGYPYVYCQSSPKLLELLLGPNAPSPPHNVHDIAARE